MSEESLSNFIKKDKGSKLFGDIGENHVKEKIQNVQRRITKIVKENLKGCGKVKVKKKGLTTVLCNEYRLCPTCEATLKGMQIAIKSELEFLESLEGIWEPDGKKVNKRITDCKNALKLIENDKRK